MAVVAGNTTKASEFNDLETTVNQNTPPGVMMPYGGAAAPTGWLLCDGTSYLRTTHADLFDIIGTAYGTADGTHFNVPDFRGQFLRGFDDGEGTDPDAAGRTAMATGGATGDAIGSVQADALQGHFTEFSGISVLAGGITVVGVHGGGGASGISYVVDGAPAGTINGIDPETDGSNGTPRTTTESRPVNASVNYIIKT